MARIAFYLLLFVAACSATPTLRYDTKSGRLLVVTKRRPTISVYWDRIAQQIVADNKGGPTVASGLYAVMHVSIFRVWAAVRSESYHLRWRYFSWPPRKYTDLCSFQKLAASHAAYHAIISVLPKRSREAKMALHRIIKGCPRDTLFHNAHAVGRRIANRVSIQYSRFVMPARPRSPGVSPIEQWQPERVPIDDPRGKFQRFLTPQWARRYTYGVRNGAAVLVPRPKPFLLIDAKLDPKKRLILRRGAKPLAVDRKLIGSVINPAFIKQAERVINASGDLTAPQKFIAELWEQGDGTSYPPGSWLTIGQWVSARDKHTDDDDTRLFFALANALSDAAVTTWYTKAFYYYCRPVRAIRNLGRLGLLGDVTFYDIRRGGYVTQPAEKFVTYQRFNGEPSPPFPEYTSGHSAFSSAAAQVLKLFTGSDRFDAQVVLAARNSRFEKGREPQRDITLKWKTFSKAAEEAGLSRIYGGIHFDDGDLIGRRLGRIVASKVFNKAKMTIEWQKLAIKDTPYKFSGSREGFGTYGQGQSFGGNGYGFKRLSGAHRHPFGLRWP